MSNNSSLKHVNVPHFGEVSTKNPSEVKENGNEKVDNHEEGLIEFFILIDAQNHHLPPS